MKDSIKHLIEQGKNETAHIVKAYKEEGLPFAIFLRNFGYERLVGPADGDLQPIYNTIANVMPKECGLIIVRDQRGFFLEFMTSGKRQGTKIAPGMMLDNKDWEQMVGWLLPRASIIFCHLAAFKPGVVAELSFILQSNQHHKTVIIPPGRGDFIKPIDSDSLLRPFIRCIYPWEMKDLNPLNHFAVADLVERVKNIAAAKSAGKDLGNSVPGKCVPPILYDQIAHNYYEVAVGHDEILNPSLREKSMEAEEANEIRHFSFWSYMRAVQAYQTIWMDDPLRITVNMVVRQVACYIRIAEMAIGEQLLMSDKSEQLLNGRDVIRYALDIRHYIENDALDKRLEEIQKKYDLLAV